MRFSKKIIVTMFVFLFVFVTVMLALFWFKNEIPDTLVTCVFGFFAAEGGCLAMIKTAETKHKKDIEDNESEDDENDGYNTDTDGDNDADNVGDNSVFDTIPERKNRRKKVCRAVKVGVGSRNRR